MVEIKINMTELQMIDVFRLVIQSQEHHKKYISATENKSVMFNYQDTKIKVFHTTITTAFKNKSYSNLLDMLTNEEGAIKLLERFDKDLLNIVDEQESSKAFVKFMKHFSSDKKSNKVELKFMSAKERANSKQNKGIEWLVDKLIYKSKLGFITANSKVGKSNFAYALAVHMCEGRDFAGHTIQEPLNGLYVSTEGSLESFESYGIPENLDTLDYKHFRWLKYKDEIINRIKEFNHKFVIIDPLYKIMNTEHNQANNKDLEKYLFEFEALAEELDCTFIVVHHNSRGSKREQWNENYQERISGSQSLCRACEFIIMLDKQAKTEDEREEELDSNDDDKKVLKIIMQKHDYKYGKEGYCFYNLTMCPDNGEITYCKRTVQDEMTTSDTPRTKDNTMRTYYKLILRYIIDQKLKTMKVGDIKQHLMKVHAVPESTSGRYQPLIKTELVKDGIASGNNTLKLDVEVAKKVMRKIV